MKIRKSQTEKKNINRHFTVREHTQRKSYLARTCALSINFSKSFVKSKFIFQAIFATLNRLSYCSYVMGKVTVNFTKDGIAFKFRNKNNSFLHCNFFEKFSVSVSRIFSLFSFSIFDPLITEEHFLNIFSTFFQHFFNIFSR